VIFALKEYSVQLCNQDYTKFNVSGGTGNEKCTYFIDEFVSFNSE
jgi:hypothetical protein